uniref:ABC transporter permease n=1 Tax=Roseihalotalea indica TaxID=2867963 RepID=A0AA49GR42_9BACT|nr:ABC transporter permease [Tunicatimonas sp. TK19036]
MNWKLAFTIAMTHLLTKKKQSVVAMLGVTFGISMFIIMISFMTGVNDFTEDMAMDNTPHLHLYKAIEIEDRKITTLNSSVEEDDWFVVEHQKPKNELSKIKNGLNLMQRIEEMPGVRGVAPQVSSQVFYNNGPIQIPGNIYGIDVEKQADLFELDQKMDAGELTDLLKGSNVIVMGKGLAEKMGIQLGDRVSITTPEGNNLNLKVEGIFSFGVAQLDQTQSYATLATVQKILQKDPSYVTDLNVKMYDVTTAAAFGEKLSRQVNDVKVEDWEEANQSLLAGEQIRNIMTFVVCFTLLVVAGFGIYNIMNMNIINKMKDIAILKATGFQGNDVTLIFMLESVSIGIVGALLGLFIGFFFSYLLSQTPFPAGEFFRIETFPVNFNPVHYTIGVFFGFLTTLLAGWFPARKASKIDPVVIIRG